MDTFDLKKYLAEGRLYEDETADLDKAMAKGLSALEMGDSSLEDEDLSQVVKEDKEQLNESITGLVVGGILAAPKLIQWIGKSIGTIGKLLGKDENSIAKGIEKFGTKWEKLYIKVIAKVIKTTGFAKPLWMKDGKQNDSDLYAVSKVVFGVILAVAAGNAISAAVSTSSPIVAALEGIFGGTKVTEIVGIVPKVTKALNLNENKL